MVRSGRVFFLTNDDGLGEPGLVALAKQARARGEVQIVAPLGPRSSCGHAVTTNRLVAIQRVDDEAIGIDGSPVDCVRLGLASLVAGASWVLSGINAGGNLGTDLWHSGTAAAAREAAIRGVPAVAFSQYLARGRAVDWERTAHWAGRVLDVLLERPWIPGTFWNVNFPLPAADKPDPPLVFCPVDPSPLPCDYHFEGEGAVYIGDYHTRERLPGHDVDVCFREQIAISLVPASWCDGAAMAAAGLVNGATAPS